MKPLKVLVIPDKFKGTLTAAGAARAMARGWAAARPEDRLELLPMSDGGDGFGQLVGELLDAEVQSARTVDAARRRRVSPWWWVPRRKLAVIDSAAVIGLAMLPPGKYHPFDLDTYGLGAVLRQAAAKGAERCVMGIGGSATNDGGFGVARAMGWRFLDRSGRRIENWPGLDRLWRIEPPAQHRCFRELTVAVDVRNPLLGPRGASRVYGPQKGLRPADFAHAERCLGRLARMVKRDLELDLARCPGAGAAGGLGFGLPAFLGARLTPGFDLFARLAGLDSRLRTVDCVLTGEGAIDRSTLMGKGVAQVAERCRKAGIPCIALAGSLLVPGTRLKLFAHAHALTELTGAAEAKSRAGVWLRRLARKVAGAIDLTPR